MAAPAAGGALVVDNTSYSTIPSAAPTARAASLVRHAREGDLIQTNHEADTAAAKAARARAARRLLRHASEGDFIQNLPVSLLRQCFDQWEAAAGYPWRPDQFPLLAPGGNGCSHQSADAAQMPPPDRLGRRGGAEVAGAVRQRGVRVGESAD